MAITETISAVGPKMREALDYIAAHPGCTKLAVARHVGPSIKFGYRTVDRCITAGLVSVRYDGRRYHLTIPERDAS